MAGNLNTPSVLWNVGDTTGRSVTGESAALPEGVALGQTGIADAVVAHALDGSSAATVAADADAALDALGGKINAIIAALVAANILEAAE